MPFRLAAADLLRVLLAVPVALFLAAPALAEIVVRVSGDAGEARDAIDAASLLAQARRSGETDPQNLYASARADYGRILGVLYSEGYYSGIISIRIDGREASAIPPLDAPGRIGRIDVEVLTGPRFVFSAARMRPYAGGTRIPPAYGDQAVARSTAIADAAEAGIAGWRAEGYAKARVAEQRIVADHARRTVDSLLILDPGPRVRFGRLDISGYERMRPGRLVKIAGFPTGRLFDPEEVAKVSDRLRRTGVFRSVALSEAGGVNPDGSLDFSLQVEEGALRRFGLGAELQGDAGLALTGYWLNRNLLGGGERLRFDGGIVGIGATAGSDFAAGIRIDRPATPGTDTNAFAEIRLKRTDDRDYTSSDARFAFGFNRVVSKTIDASIALSIEGSRVRDRNGVRYYRQIALPITATRDRRDSATNPTGGFYLSAEVRPFLGFGATGSGLRLSGDLRGYRAFGRDDRLVMAGRVQAGAVYGPGLLSTPRDYLFYSGGGGTVRGQPYQSLGVPVARVGTPIGGQSFVGFSGEARIAVSERIGVVGFYDAGFVSPTDFFGAGEWHSGAGVGLRYFTAIGPVRLDIAAPVSGRTGKGVQFYLGIGQAF
ncbi:MAG: autotransporter assembly complex protein TamA [Pseudomonadota bacterium]